MTNVTVTADVTLHRAAEVVSWASGIGGVIGKAAIKQVAKRTAWTATKSKSAVENAFGHWKKHKGEFPEFQNAKQYVEGTQRFLNSPPKGTLIKTRSNGDTLLYDPKTNAFGAKDANGAPRTMFRPKDGMDYWNKQ
jgi:filamentous hemagglutinin